jgi:signal transduction histidine kinase
MGIPADDLSRIFDRFYRVEKSRGLTGHNAGLGLAITKRILDLHESVITVTSEPGKTVFRFTLGYASNVGGAEARPAPAERAKRQVPSLAYPMARPTSP